MALNPEKAGAAAYALLAEITAAPGHTLHNSDVEDLRCLLNYKRATWDWAILYLLDKRMIVQAEGRQLAVLN